MYMIHCHFVVQNNIILLLVHIIFLQLKKKRFILGLQLLTVKPFSDVTHVCYISLT